MLGNLLWRAQSKQTVVLIGWYYYPKIGGVESMMETQAKILSECGYKVFIFTSKYNNDLPTREIKNGIEIIRSEFLIPSVNTKKSNNDLVNFLEKYFTEIKPNIIQCHNLTYCLAPDKSKVIFDISKEFTPYVLEYCHNAQQRDPERTKELVMLNWYKIICVSNYSAQSLVAQGANKNNINIVYNCVDEKLFNTKVTQELSELTNERRIKILFPARILTSSGTLNPHKPILETFEALSILKKNQGNFILILLENVVEDKIQAKLSREKINKLINEYDLTNNVKIINEIPHTSMPSLYKSVDIVLAPFPNESFGLVFAEAIMMGKPPIISKGGAGVEIIINNKTGYIINYTVSELSTILEKIIASPKLLTKLSNQARQNAKRRFGIKSYKKEILRIYNTLR